MEAVNDSLYLQGLLQREYVTDPEIRYCLRKQDEFYRAGRTDLSLLDVLVECGFVSPSQAVRIKHDLEEGKNFNLHVPGFRIVEKVGEGGMGMVYRARQSSLGRDCALKVLRADLSADKGFLDRFRKESINTAQINHPHVVGVIDVGVEASGRQYIVMEFIEGIDLSVELFRRKKFPELETAKIGLEIARALGHLHRVGFLHRDVKPQNIMITKDRIAKLTDMGLARRMDDGITIAKERGKALGTPDYISPEQIRGEPDLDGRCDMYALGGTLFHVVTGRPPFVADTPAKVMGRHMEAPLVPPKQFAPDLTYGLSEIIEVLMAKEKKDRYANADDMVADFESVVSRHPPFIALEKLGRPLPEPVSFDAGGSGEGAIPVITAPQQVAPAPVPAPRSGEPSTASLKPVAVPPAGGPPMWVWLTIGLSLALNGLLAFLMTR